MLLDSKIRDIYSQKLCEAAGACRLPKFDGVVNAADYIVKTMHRSAVGRNYHNNMHILKMLHIFDDFPQLKKHYTNVSSFDFHAYNVAALFHDVIITGDSPESDSVEVAQDMLSDLGFPVDFVTKVCDTIRITDYKEYGLDWRSSPDSIYGLMRASDFSGFATYPRMYKYIQNCVVQELISRFTPDTSREDILEFFNNRKNFLLTTHENINNLFPSQSMQRQARSNIDSELRMIIVNYQQHCDTVSSLFELYSAPMHPLFKPEEVQECTVVVDHTSVGHCQECGIGTVELIIDPYTCYCSNNICPRMEPVEVDDPQDLPYWVF